VAPSQAGLPVNLHALGVELHGEYKHHMCVRALAGPVILILLLFKVHPFAWWLNLLMLGRHRSQTSKNRDPFCITLLRSALRAILNSRQSAHARVPAILEERVMPMITHISSLLQTFPSMALILFLLRLMLETLLVLVFILFEEIERSRPLIPNVPYLLFHDISLFPFSGPIVGIGLFIPCVATWCRPCHINAKCEVQLSFRRSIITLYHIYAWERLGIDLHSILT
jgi:hypothetical protein